MGLLLFYFLAWLVGWMVSGRWFSGWFGDAQASVHGALIKMLPLPVERVWVPFLGLGRLLGHNQAGRGIYE